MEFDLNEHVSSFQELSKEAQSVMNPEDKLAQVTEILALAPDAVITEDIFDPLNDLCLSYSTVQPSVQKQLVYIVCSSIITQCENTAHVIEVSDTEQFRQHKKILEVYGYLLHVLLTFLGQEDISAYASVAGGKKPLTEVVAKFKNNCKEIEDCLEASCEILKLKLGRLFETTPELDGIVQLFTRPTYSMMELEQRVKAQGVKALMIQVICRSVKYHGHGSSAQAAIVQNLTYFTHLTGMMAELLHKMATQYDYLAVLDETLQEVSNKQFNANDNNGPKSISQFIIRLSELSASLVLKQMTNISKLLDNNSYTLRCSVVEACGNIIVEICSKEDELNRQQAQTDKLLDLVQQRFLDQNPFVRTKAVQALLKVCELDVKFINRRQVFAELAVRNLDDKSSLVRRNCIKLVSKLIMTHPFGVLHGTSLSRSTWEKRLNLALKKEETLEDTPQEDEAQEELVDTQSAIKLKLTIQYYKEALLFIKSIEAGTLVVAKLLYSRNKNEVLEAMEYFVLADAYDIKDAKLGIKKMIHLIWMKGTNDEGSSIANHLLLCYQNLFLTSPQGIRAIEAAAYIAKNLISLTYQTSVSDLASLEKLLSSMYEEKLIDNTVIKILWQIYNDAMPNKKMSMKQRRGAVIILGMTSLANHEIASRGLEWLLSIGLTSEDLILAKYSCIVLQRIQPNESFQASKEKEAVTKLTDCLLTFTEDPEWYPLAEQIINAIFILSSKPDEVCNQILRSRMDETFNQQVPNKTTKLSQLLFIVGHIAIKTIIYLEKCEAEFKKKKIQMETENAKNKNKKDKDELEMIGGTSEDDFTDAVIYIKERELLYGENSLLSKFGGLCKEICANNLKYNNELLQRNSVLCMSKLMCVSSRYCEDSLPLLITLMEKSPDPIIRSNAVLGLGDMAVCFNNLVDENTDYLYRRLNDENIMVQRTCLMTVTFLILAGQVKVKGQLATMAKCLENEDHGISDMCRLFFTELASKDNAIYNGFIDIFSGLSHDKDLTKDSMKRILRFLIAFIDKERQQKQLSEKLLVRLNKSSNEEEWKDVAFVLQTIPYKNEKVTQAINDGYKMVGVR